MPTAETTAGAIDALLAHPAVMTYLVSVAGVMAGAKLLTSAVATLMPSWGLPKIENQPGGASHTVTPDRRSLYLKLTAGAFALSLTLLAWSRGLLVGELSTLALTVVATWWMSMGLHDALKILPLYARAAELGERLLGVLRAAPKRPAVALLMSALMGVYTVGCAGPPNVQYESPVGSVAEQVDRRAASYLALAGRIAAARGGKLIGDDAWPAIKAANAVVIARIDTARGHVNADRLAEARLALDALDASAEVVEAAALALLPALASPVPALNPDPIGTRRVVETPATRLLE